jgi:hypothetical protein
MNTTLAVRCAFHKRLYGSARGNRVNENHPARLRPRAASRPRGEWGPGRAAAVRPRAHYGFIGIPRSPDTAAVPPTSRDLHIWRLAAPDALEASPLAGAALEGMPPLARSALSGRPWIADRPESRSGGWPALPGPGQVPTFGRRPPPAPLPLGAPHPGRERRMYRTIVLILSRGLVLSPQSGGFSGRESGIFILHPIALASRRVAVSRAAPSRSRPRRSSASSSSLRTRAWPARPRPPSPRSARGA